MATGSLMVEMSMVHAVAPFFPPVFSQSGCAVDFFSKQHTRHSPNCAAWWHNTFALRSMQSMSTPGVPLRKRKRTSTETSSHSRFLTVSELGQGTNGSVHKVEDHQTRTLIASKRFKELFSHRTQTMNVIREIQFGRALRHPNIVRCLRVHCESIDTGVHLHLELLQESLDRFLQRSNRCVAPDITRRWMYQLVCSLFYLHSGDIIHRDIKPANLLIDAHGTLKLADFGMARWIGSDSNLLESHVCTRWYRPPEIILQEPRYGSAVDMWSVGCIFAELLESQWISNPAQRTPLFPGQACPPLSPVMRPTPVPITAPSPPPASTSFQLELILGVLEPLANSSLAFVSTDAGRLTLHHSRSRHLSRRKLVDRFAAASDPQAIDLLSKLLTFNPAHRLSAFEALRHPYFSPIADKRIERPMVYRVHTPSKQQQQQQQPRTAADDQDQSIDLENKCLCIQCVELLLSKCTTFQCREILKRLIKSGSAQIDQQ